MRAVIIILDMLLMGIAAFAITWRAKWPARYAILGLVVLLAAFTLMVRFVLPDHSNDILFEFLLVLLGICAACGISWWAKWPVGQVIPALIGPPVALVLILVYIPMEFTLGILIPALSILLFVWAVEFVARKAQRQLSPAANVLLAMAAGCLFGGEWPWQAHHALGFAVLCVLMVVFVTSFAVFVVDSHSKNRPLAFSAALFGSIIVGFFVAATIAALTSTHEDSVFSAPPMVEPLFSGMFFFLFVLLCLITTLMIQGRRDRGTIAAWCVLVACFAAGGWALASVWQPTGRYWESPPPISQLPPLMSTPLDPKATSADTRQDSSATPGPDEITRQPSTQEPVAVPPPPEYEVGDRTSIFDPGTGVTYEMELIHVTEHTYIWLEVGSAANRESLVASSQRFESDIYPIIRAYFGSDLSPGVNGDARIFIVHGSYPTSDYSGWTVHQDSGHRTIFVSLRNTNIENQDYLALLAHEFQHIVQGNNDFDEERWLNEGLSELASHLAGFHPGMCGQMFRVTPETQLNKLPYELEDPARCIHYGASYRFVRYLWEQFGDDFLWDLAHHPANGMASVDAVLAEQKAGVTADDVFADWVITNVIDEGEYAYAKDDWLNFKPDPYSSSGYDPAATAIFQAYPAQWHNALPPYSANQFQLRGHGQVVIHFAGTTQTPTLPSSPHSGQTSWWSMSRDEPSSYLTYHFDLSGVSQANLHFWAWYDLDKDKEECVSVLAATTTGGPWTELPAGFSSQHCSDQGFTGQSDGWVEKEVELRSYAGSEVWIRFEHTGNGNVDGKGFLVDDLSIPELDWADTCESTGGATAQGFILAGSPVPVQWAVQAAGDLTGDGSVQVRRMLLDEHQTGQLELDLDQGEAPWLIISPLARDTYQPVTYRFDIQRKWYDHYVCLLAALCLVAGTSVLLIPRKPGLQTDREGIQGEEMHGERQLKATDTRPGRSAGSRG